MQGTQISESRFVNKRKIKGTGASDCHRTCTFHRGLRRPWTVPLALVFESRRSRLGCLPFFVGAQYVEDMDVPGLWHGAVVRSLSPHARIKNIQLKDDFDWSQVVTADVSDIPGETCVAMIERDVPLIAERSQNSDDLFLRQTSPLHPSLLAPSKGDSSPDFVWFQVAQFSGGGGQSSM